MNFDEWWGEDYDDTDNPFKIDSFKYWAYAGWYGHAEQTQFHPDWDTVEPFLERIAYLEKLVHSQGAQQEWLSPTEEQITKLLEHVTIEANLNILYVTVDGMKVFARQIEQLLKEKNHKVCIEN